jgi:hypothetical protein
MGSMLLVVLMVISAVVGIIVRGLGVNAMAVALVSFVSMGVAVMMVRNMAFVVVRASEMMRIMASMVMLELILILSFFLSSTLD